MTETDPALETPATVAVLAESLRDLKARLYGNGQPGDIRLILDKIDKLCAYYWMAVGAMCILGFLAPILVDLFAPLWRHARP